MRYRLDLVLRPAEGALLRVLGLAEHRGFRPVALDAEHSGLGWRMRLTVDGERSPESLRAQMQKLYDCLEVEVSHVHE